VKWRYFRHILHGGDPDSERIYRWHIETRAVVNARIRIGMDGKPGIETYLQDCRRLLASMHASGFLARYAVPVDPDGELLGGAHRVSCALALEMPEIPVKDEMRRAWAPAWDKNWFLANGMGQADFERLSGDWMALYGANGAEAGNLVATR
jgi:hypothetical protein